MIYLNISASQNIIISSSDSEGGGVIYGWVAAACLGRSLITASSHGGLQEATSWHNN